MTKLYECYCGMTYRGPGALKSHIDNVHGGIGGGGLENEVADETPKRVRGQKEREAAYRAGYEDGYRRGAEDERSQAATREVYATIREQQIADGLTRLRGTSIVKRTRRKRAQNGALVDPPERIEREAQG